jgi:hypothetical protein
MSIGKRGEIVSDSAIELIIAAAASVVLILLIVSVYDPSYDHGDEIAKSYFERLKEGIDAGSGDILMLDRGSKGLNFYLIYFADIGSLPFILDGKTQLLVPKKSGDHVVCICYDKVGGVFCGHCENLDLPAFSDSEIKGEDGFWVIEDGGRVGIEEKGGGYVFSIE